MPASRPDWETYFLGIAAAVAARGDCRRAQHGAVIVDSHNRIVATGYNGTPSGGPSCLAGECPRAFADVPSLSSYDTGPGACRSVHAEANALLYSNWTAIQGGTIYVTGEPCPGCQKLIDGSGIARTVYPT